MIALLAGAVAALVGAEWPRLSARYGNEARRRRERTKRKSQLKLLRTETEVGLKLLGCASPAEVTKAHVRRAGPPI